MKPNCVLDAFLVCVCDACISVPLGRKWGQSWFDLVLMQCGDILCALCCLLWAQLNEKVKRDLLLNGTMENAMSIHVWEYVRTCLLIGK